MTASPSFSLKPLVAPWMTTLQQHPALLDRLIRTYRAPLNILRLEPFECNVREYAAVFDEHDLHDGILFARKANKCRAFVKRAGQLGIGVDTASHRELEQALEAGVPAERIVLTTAIKEERTLCLALLNDVLIMLDNEDECQLIDGLAKSMNRTAYVGVRVSGFAIGETKLYSRLYDAFL